MKIIDPWLIGIIVFDSSWVSLEVTNLDAIIFQVSKGKHVFIRTGPQGRGTIHGEDYSTFSGFLLFKIDDVTTYWPVWINIFPEK